MKIKEMILISLMSALIAVGAFIKLPISIVPVTLQTLFVVLTGLLLKKKAIYSVLLYIVIGLIGIPVFASGGGIGYVLMPSFGYLLGFAVCAYIVGHAKGESVIELLIRSIIGMLFIYVIGVMYFFFIEYFYYHKVFEASYLLINLFLVYLPGDSLSIVVALIIHQRLNKINVINTQII
jgi:biotin transport system substrate-specific component